MNNIYNSYTLENHPVIQTVKMSPPQPPPNVKMEKEELAFDKKNNFDEKMLIKIYNSLCTKNKLSDILRQTGITFVFNSTFVIQKINQINATKHDIYYLLHSMIGYCITLETSFNQESFSIALKTLSFITQNCNNEIAFNMVSYVLFSVAPFVNEIDMNEVIVFLHDLISKNYNSTISSAIVYIIFSLGSSGPFDTKTELLYQYLTEITKTTDKAINESQAASLFDRCFDELRSLSIKGIMFLDGFADKLPWCVAERLFKKIGFFCANYLHQCDQEYLRKLLPSAARKESAENRSFDVSFIIRKPQTQSLNTSNTSEADIYNEKSFDPSVFRSKKISFDGFGEAYELQRSTISTKITHSFKNISPFAKDVKILTPSFASEQIAKLPNQFMDLERRIMYIQKISTHYQESQEAIIESFLTILRENFDMDLAFGFIIFLSKCKEDIPLKKILEVIGKKVFDPRISIFDAEEDYLPYFQMRFILFSILTQFQTFNLFNFMHEYIQFPQFSAELFFYLTTIFHAKKIQSNDSYRNILSTFLPVYINSYTEENEKLSTALKYIFSFFIITLKSTDTVLKFLTNDYFVDLFISLLFDENIRKQCLDIGIHLFRNSPNETIKYFSEYVEPIFITFKGSDSLQAIDLMTSLIESSMLIMQGNTNYMKRLSNLKKSMCSAVSSIKDREVPKEKKMKMVIAFIRYLAVLSQVDTLNIFERSELTSSISEIKGEDDNEELFEACAGLIIGRIKNVTTQIYIKEPKYLLLFYTVFDEKAIDFLQEMFKFAHFNRLQCHLGQIDLAILQKHEKEAYKMTEKTRKLFIDIAEVASSLPVVFKFISLMNSEGGKTLPPCFEEFLEILKEIFKTKKSNPTCSIPLTNRNCSVSLSEFTDVKQEDEVTLLTWILFDYGSGKSNLLEAVTKEGILHITMEKNAMYISFNKGQDTFHVNMHPDCWTLIAITFAPSNIQIRCNGDFYTFPVSFSFTDITNIKLGFNGDIAEHPSYIGPFSFINGMIGEKEYNGLLKSGPHPHAFPNSLVSVNIESHDQFVFLQQCDMSDEKTSTVKVELSNKEIPAVFNFSDVLIRNFTARVLIPLYSQVFLVTKSEYQSYPTVLIRKITEVFQVLFSVSSLSEEVFVNEKSWDVVGLQLSKYSEYLSEDIYNLFFLTYAQSTNQAFKANLIYSVLMEPSLWINSPTNTTKRVTFGWYSELLPTPFNLNFRMFFEKFFGAFWSNRNDVDGINDLESREIVSSLEEEKGIKVSTTKEFDLQSIKEIYQLRENSILTLDKIAQQHFTFNDYQDVIHILFETKNKEAILGIIRLIKRLVLSNCFSTFTSEQLTTLPKILDIANIKDDAIALEIISIFNKIYEKKIFADKIIDIHIELLIKMLAKDKHQPSFIRVLSRIAEDRPEFMSLCFSILAHHTEMVNAWIEVGIKPDKKYCINKAWALWGLFAACKCYDDGRVKEMNTLFTFILNCDTKYYDVYFLYLSDITNNAACLRAYLREASRMICQSMSSRTTEQIKKFLDVAVFFMFFRASESQEIIYAPVLKQCEKEIGTDIDIFDYKEKDLKIDHSLSLTERLTRATQLKEVHFGIDIDLETKQWVDNELGKTCLEILSKIKCSEYNEIAGMIIAFCARQAPFVKLEEYINNFKPSTSFQQLIRHALNEEQTRVEEKQAFTAIPTFLELFDKKKEYFKFEIARSAGFAIKFRFNTYKKKTKYSGITITKTLFTFESIKIGNEAKKKKTQLAWKSLCSNLTAECAPWHKSVHSDHQVPRYKRDMTICTNYCPMKMKQNKNYDDHLEASYARDSGSQTIAQEMVKKYRETQPDVVDNFLFTGNDATTASDTMTSETRNTSIVENDREFENNKIYFEDEAELIKIDSIKKIKFFILKKSIVIDCEDSEERTTLEARKITMILMRSFTLRQTGIEIFTKTGETFLIHFLSLSPTQAMNVLQKRKEFYNNCRLQLYPSYKENIKHCDETRRWVNGEMSNFEYLMFLNIMSGRTFNDSSMYPIFPWILSSYNCDDVNDATFRDLSKPIGFFGESRHEEINARMRDMEQFDQSAFMFSACYSTPLSVFLYNLRMEPFTTLHIQMQSGKFDHAARIFSSVEDAYRMTTNHMNDYRELIPEFFYCTAFLRNENQFDLGKVGEKDISDVALPKWAHGDATEFIYLHRKALERAQNIEKWIDLIWGSKSRGEAAREAFNLFDPNMYDEAWEKLDREIPDPTSPEYQGRKILIEATMTNCGQIPPLLFTEDHPSKNIRPKPKVNEHVIDTKPDSGIIASIIDFEHENIVIVTDAGRVSYVSFTEQKKDMATFNAKKVTRRKGSCFTKVLCRRTNKFPLNQDTSEDSYYKLLFATTVGSLICIDPEQKLLSKVRCHCGVVTCLCSSGDLIVSGGSDTSTHVLSPKLENVFTFSSYSDEISCCAACQEFKVIVSATKHGTIYIIDSRRNQVFKVLHISNEEEHNFAIPKQVVITKGWGFIIIYYTKSVNGEEKHFITTYTINGEKRSDFEIDFPVSYMTSLTSYQGFDYILLGSEVSGMIYSFEAFFASKENIVSCAECGSSAVNISASIKRNEFAVLTKEGKVHFFDLSRIKINV